MRYALIMAGGSGTRLWPMSRAELPKQLIPFIDGKSLLRIAFDRFDGLIPAEQRYVCAGRQHREAIFAAVPALRPGAVPRRTAGPRYAQCRRPRRRRAGAKDPEAVIGVFTADHLIEPVDEFQRIIAQGFDLVERSPNTLVTFGIAPTHPATGYGYLELGEPLDGAARRGAAVPRKAAAGDGRAIRRGKVRSVTCGTAACSSGVRRRCWTASAATSRPSAEGLTAIARAWDTPRSRQGARRGLSDAEEDQRRLCRDGAGLARSGGSRGGHSHAAAVARHRLVALLRRDLPAR